MDRSRSTAGKAFRTIVRFILGALAGLIIGLFLCCCLGLFITEIVGDHGGASEKGIFIAVVMSFYAPLAALTGGVGGVVGRAHLGTLAGAIIGFAISALMLMFLMFDAPGSNRPKDWLIVLTLVVGVTAISALTGFVGSLIGSSRRTGHAGSIGPIPGNQVSANIAHNRSGG
jgi:hypothetical protein